MTDYDPKQIFKEPIFMDTIPENIDITEEKFDGNLLNICILIILDNLE